MVCGGGFPTLLDLRGLCSLCWLILLKLLSAGERKTSKTKPTRLPGSKWGRPFHLKVSEPMAHFCVQHSLCEA